MILSAQILASEPTRQYDVCIVGAGPAGLALATVLAHSALRTCIIESGTERTTPFTDGLRETESDGIRIKPESRERVLGGASLTWAGLSSPLDPIDFASRQWVPYSGWPFDRDTLVPYYERATASFRFPSWAHLQSFSWLPESRPGIPEWRELQEKGFLAADPPQRFGRDFIDVCRERLDLILGGTVTTLLGDPSGHANRVQVLLPDRTPLSIGARVTVLAAGGIENARLLLNSTFACRAGLGNEHDQVGRYFMNHPKADHGTITLNKPQGALPGYFGFLLPGLGYVGFVGLRLREEVQRREQVLNSYVRFEPVFDWSDNPGVEAFVHYAKGSTALMRAFRRTHQDELVELRSYAETGDDWESDLARPGVGQHRRRLSAIVRHRRPVANYIRARLSRRDRPTVTAVRLRNFMEMAPDPANRVQLSDRTDALGVRVPHVSHRCSPLDRRSAVALHRTLGREIAEAGWGRLHSTLDDETRPWPIDGDASHHMGATRMGHAPATSVVDANCRLHSTPSTCVLGASLFPTSGCANPTYTIAALALRLGDHLKAALWPNR